MSGGERGRKVRQDCRDRLVARRGGRRKPGETRGFRPTGQSVVWTLRPGPDRPCIARLAAVRAVAEKARSLPIVHRRGPPEKLVWCDRALTMILRSSITGFDPAGGASTKASVMPLSPPHPQSRLDRTPGRVHPQVCGGNLSRNHCLCRLPRFLASRISAYFDLTLHCASTTLDADVRRRRACECDPSTTILAKADSASCSGPGTFGSPPASIKIDASTVSSPGTALSSSPEGSSGDPAPMKEPQQRRRGPREAGRSAGPSAVPEDGERESVGSPPCLPGTSPPEEEIAATTVRSGVSTRTNSPGPI